VAAVNEQSTTAMRDTLAREWRQLAFVLVFIAVLVVVWPLGMTRGGGLVVGVAFGLCGAVAGLRARRVASLDNPDARFVTLFAVLIVIAFALVAVFEILAAR
jgi:hypothetical protein